MTPGRVSDISNPSIHSSNTSYGTLADNSVAGFQDTAALLITLSLKASPNTHIQQPGKNTNIYNSDSIFQASLAKLSLLALTIVAFNLQVNGIKAGLAQKKETVEACKSNGDNNNLNKSLEAAQLPMVY